MMHGPEKSDLAIVAGKPANKAEQSAAESVERRAGTKGNANQQSTHWTQSQARVSQALERIWQAFAVTHPKVGAVCGKAARTVLCGGRAMKRTSLPLHRREFITLLGGTAMAWPIAARAQQGERMRRIGVLMGSPNDAVGHANATALVQGLGALGWQEGSNLRIALRWCGGVDPALFERYVAEVFAFGPEVIVGLGTAEMAAGGGGTRHHPAGVTNGHHPH